MPWGLDGCHNGLVSSPPKTDDEHRGGVEHLRRRQLEQQVIFDSVPAMIWYKDRNISGYADGKLDEHAMGAHYLPKPFTGATLLRAVARALDDRELLTP